MKHIKTNQHNHKRQPRINSRAKGASGEREVCTILSKLTGGMVVTRSLESVRSGGADITCIPGLSIEVKRKKYVLPNDMSPKLKILNVNLFFSAKKIEGNGLLR